MSRGLQKRGGKEMVPATTVGGRSDSRSAAAARSDSSASVVTGDTIVNVPPTDWASVEKMVTYPQEAARDTTNSAIALVGEVYRTNDGRAWQQAEETIYVNNQNAHEMVQFVKENNRSNLRLVLIGGLVFLVVCAVVAGTLTLTSNNYINRAVADPTERANYFQATETRSLVDATATGKAENWTATRAAEERTATRQSAVEARTEQAPIRAAQTATAVDSKLPMNYNEFGGALDGKKPIEGNFCPSDTTLRRIVVEMTADGQQTISRADLNGDGVGDISVNDPAFRSNITQRVLEYTIVPYTPVGTGVTRRMVGGYCSFEQ